VVFKPSAGCAACVLMSITTIEPPRIFLSKGLPRLTLNHAARIGKVVEILQDGG
jgi:hypothetical protein